MRRNTPQADAGRGDSGPVLAARGSPPGRQSLCQSPNRPSERIVLAEVFSECHESLCRFRSGNRCLALRQSIVHDPLRGGDVPTHLFHPDTLLGEGANYSSLIESQFCDPGSIVQRETQASVLESGDHQVLEGVSWHCA